MQKADILERQFKTDNYNKDLEQNNNMRLKNVSNIIQINFPS